jgi:hypothetical protein
MEDSTSEVTSVFQTRYNEFIEDLFGALPEYTEQLHAAKKLDEQERLNRFQSEVKIINTFNEANIEENNKNPGTILPGITVSDAIWNSLSENTQKAIWEYVRILSICCFMESGFSNDTKPAWMDEAMNDMKQKLEGIDFGNIINKFMTFFKTGESTKDTNSESGKSEGIPAGFDKLFENGFPKIPEKFLKGHMAKLAQEIVKDITPEDLGISKEMIEECEKNPSRAFDILFQVFGNNPGAIQKTVQKIGKRLQQKIMSGAIRPQEIAREAEELMKEFASNSSFVEMMEGIKGAFGFEDMNIAKAAGRESSARLSMVKERLKKKASEKEAKKAAASTIIPISAQAIANSDAAVAALLREEEEFNRRKVQKKKSSGNGGNK